MALKHKLLIEIDRLVSESSLLKAIASGRDVTEEDKIVSRTKREVAERLLKLL